MRQSNQDHCNSVLVTGYGHTGLHGNKSFVCHITTVQVPLRQQYMCLFVQITSEKTNQPCDVNLVPLCSHLCGSQFLVCRSQTTSQLYHDL